MKLQTAIYLTCLFFCINQLNAQDSGFSQQIKLGLMAGYNNATAKDISSNNFDFSNVDAFYIGGSVELHLVKRFSLESALLISQKGFEVISNAMETNSYKMDYLSLQLQGKLYVTQNIRLILGSEASLLLTTSADNGNGIDPDSFETSDYSYLLGLEFGFKDKFAINARFNNSFSSLVEFTHTDQSGNPIGDTPLKNRVFMLGATFYPFRFEMF